MKSPLSTLDALEVRHAPSLPRLAAVAARAKHMFDRAVEHHLARRLDKAEIEYRRVLRLDPFDIEAHSNLGAILCQKGRIDEAQSHFNRALQLQPRPTGRALRSVA